MICAALTCAAVLSMPGDPEAMHATYHNDGRVSFARPGPDVIYHGKVSVPVRPVPRPCEPFYGTCDKWAWRIDLPAPLPPVAIPRASSWTPGPVYPRSGGGSPGGYDTTPLPPIVTIGGGGNEDCGCLVDETPDAPTDTPGTPIAPVPLPGSAWLLLAALGMMMRMHHEKSRPG